ncbi:hypothetical protein ACFQZT_20330 [Paenibacillus sp. GCM10027628]|uniref:hypothetical protein n=1 Tax=Paenibacillus sp. GCM10027628 TaxID=3273413 RepID=UPI0036262BDA
MSHQLNERLLKWYDFNELPLGVTYNIAFPPSPASQNVISAIVMEQIKSDDRINLEASIQWTVTLTGTTTTEPGPVFQILAFQQATFQIWRDSIGSLGTLVCQYSDTGAFGTSGLIPGPSTTVTVVAPSTFTTDITCTDFNVPKGTHSYFLTVTLPSVNASVATGGASIENLTARAISPTVTGWSFEGYVIDNN